MAGRPVRNRLKRDERGQKTSLRWRFLSLSMPLVALLFFLASNRGPGAFRDVEPFLTAPCPQEAGPSWGVLRTPDDLKPFLKRYFREVAPPDVDFEEETVLFLIPGPEGGRYGRFRFSGYRNDPAGGITVCCEEGQEESGVQLARVPRFEGQALFCFGELP